MNHIIILFCLLLSNSFSSFSQNVFSDTALVYIEGGTFYIGCNNYDEDEKNGKKIKISDFFISKFEISNRQYCDFLNSAKINSNKLPSYIKISKNRKDNIAIFKEDGIFYVKDGLEDYPVVFVSWFGANAFCDFYNLRLPTEAEWEFAAKSKKHSVFKKCKIFSGSNNVDEVGWYKNNSGNKVHKQGLKKANKFGLFDMSGNVDEWCEDWYVADYYNNMPSENPSGPKKANFKVYRGGSWYNTEKMLRVTNRRAANPVSRKATIGFRVVKDIAVFCPVK
ncbi:MAG: formylglycine-generating enzyme family protein [Bacteroidales bacterium]|nr:formylglycine-generating enzyme family protein [Bacteroidales bacterium]